MFPVGQLKIESERGWVQAGRVAFDPELSPKEGLAIAVNYLRADWKSAYLLMRASKAKKGCTMFFGGWGS
jgi:hypothetical protein